LIENHPQKEVQPLVLEVELKYYAEQKPDLLKHHKNQYVLIKGDQLVRAFSTAEEAFTAGVKQFGKVPFLIQLVREDEKLIQQPSLAVGIISAHSQ
jgi:hypothetical protein